MLNFIGTIHCGITDNDELIEIINNLNPEFILIEMVQEDIDNNTIENYPDEMKYVLNWCKEKNILCYGFDSNIDISHKNYSKENESRLIEFQMREIKKRNWKEFNNSKICKLIDCNESFEVIDSFKERTREIEMKNNILNILEINKSKFKQGIVITGCGHLDFFRKEFVDANFPLSNN